MPPRGGYPPGFPVEYARPRWLDRQACAEYICVRRSTLSRLTKQGLLPKPSLLLGPRTPRWDREAVDALFLGRSRQDDADVAINKVVAGILAEGQRKQQRRAERAAAEAERKAKRELLRSTRA